MISAGRVLIMPKGDFNASMAYEMLDLVSYQGSSYIAKQGTQGNLPTNKTYWQIMAFGAASTNLSANFATLETTALSAHEYDAGEYLVDVDGNLCIVTTHIDIGDQIIIDSNVEKRTVEEMVDDVLAKMDTLASETASLIPRIGIDTTVDLGTLTDVGEYYKKYTTFFVTGAPLGIDSIPTATFRLRVEKGSDGNNKILQTLITDENKVYTRAYKNSTWTTWTTAETKLTFDGPSSQWDGMSQYEKALYRYVILTD